MLKRLCLIALAATIAQSAKAQPDTAAPDSASHPPQVALVDEGKLGSVYRETQNSLRLYTNDSDADGKSMCNGGCAMAWPPLRAPANAAPVGAWTIIARNDGTRQWAYQGKPVYTRFHDAPSRPTGAGIEGWRLIPYMSKADSVVTRADAIAATGALWDVIDSNHDGVLNLADRDAQRDIAFNRIDTDRNGELSRAELGASRPEFRNMQDANRAAWFIRIDTDGNGGLSRDELAAGGADTSSAERSGQLRQLFQFVDTDEDGQVKRAEFDAAVAEHLTMIDADRDGNISKSEYEAGRKMLRSMIEANQVAD